MLPLGPRGALAAAVLTATLVPLAPAHAEDAVRPIVGEPRDTDAVAADVVSAPGAPATGAEDRYLVRFAGETSVPAQADAVEAEGAEIEDTFTSVLKGAVFTGTPAEADEVAALPGVVAVAPDAPVRVSTEPWGLDRIDQRSLPLDRSYTPAATGAGVTVYVVDSGVRRDHSDLGGRVRVGANFTVNGGDGGDCNGHGTHVAGTVAGASSGVAKRATVVPVRVLDCAGSGSMSGVVAGLDWVAAHHPTGAPAVVNLSLGGGANSVLDQAVRGVIADGITVAAAAGNEGVDACQKSPARVPAALTVAATTSADRQPLFSNHGPCVDLYAPGVDITSAWHTGTNILATLSGTSMASPHVAGAAALLLGEDPTMTPAQVNAGLLEQATTGAVVGVSSGTPNRLLFTPAPRATQPAPTTPPPAADEPRATVPGRATVLGARGLRRAATVTWRRASTGGAPLIRQRVLVYRKGARVRTVAVTPSTTRLTVRNLRPSRGYSFRVVAQNRVGSGPASAASRRVTVRR